MSDQARQVKPVVVVLPAEIDVTNSELAFGLLAAALAPGVPVVIADLTATVLLRHLRRPRPDLRA